MADNQGDLISLPYLLGKMDGLRRPTGKVGVWTMWVYDTEYITELLAIRRAMMKAFAKEGPEEWRESSR